jgi:hypothetical protein
VRALAVKQSFASLLKGRTHARAVTMSKIFVCSSLQAAIFNWLYSSSKSLTRAGCNNQQNQICSSLQAAAVWSHCIVALLREIKVSLWLLIHTKAKLPTFHGRCKAFHFAVVFNSKVCFHDFDATLVNFSV